MAHRSEPVILNVSLLDGMRITWTLTPVPEETLVAVRCDDVPAGIQPEDHEAGLISTLSDLDHSPKAVNE